MKVKSIRLKDFKRFTDLTIKNLPETATLVVMIGPNGSGKSSVFDALHAYRFSFFSDEKTYFDDSHYYKDNIDYFSKSKSFRNDNKPVEVKYHTKPKTQETWEKSVRMRTSYRNDSTDNHSLSFGPPEEDRQFLKLAENDESVTMNLWRLASQWLSRTSGNEPLDKSLESLQKDAFSELYSAMERLFSDQKLVLTNLGDPANGIFFQFDKGTSKRFSFKNLSSGEKAALDLLLDLIVTKVELPDTVFCIDEPEAHIHTKLQGKLLEELYYLVPGNSQLWIATHSIGMVRKAQDLYQNHPESVVFLDFGEYDFDNPVTLTPTTPDPAFWARIYDIALDDLAKLVAPKRIVLCESKAQDPSKGFDAACYNQIFGIHYPDTRFISVGGKKDVETADTKLIPVIEAIANSTEILRLRDRDDATDQDIVNNAKKGIRTLSRQAIEDYLTDDEVLTQLCVSQGKPDKVGEFLVAKDKEIKKIIKSSSVPNKRKPTVQRIQQQAKKILEIPHIGDSIESFMRDILVPLIQPDTAVYQELHRDIFE